MVAALKQALICVWMVDTVHGKIRRYDRATFDINRKDILFPMGI